MKSNQIYYVAYIESKINECELSTLMFPNVKINDVQSNRIIKQRNYRWQMIKT